MNNKRSELFQLNTNLNVFLVLSLLVAWYVGFRMPNLWSVNYYIPGIFDGFYRRGLMGSILSIFGELRFNYYFIVTLQFTVFAILLLVILRYILRADPTSKILIIMYFLAPTGGYLFHEVGYIDQLLYLLLFCAIFFSNPFVGLGLMLASLFIHEEALFTTIPLYLSYLIINRSSSRWIWANIIIIGFTFSIIYLFLQTVSPENIQHFMQKIASSFGQTARVEYYLTFNNTFAAQALTNTFIGLHGELAPPPHGHYDSLYFEVVLACLIASLIARQFCDKKNSAAYNVLVFLAVLFSCISPLCLVFFGIDSHRWVFLSYSSCVIFFCLIKDKMPVTHFSILVFIFTLFLAYGKLWYFDGYAPRRFEKTNLIDFWQNELVRIVKNRPVF